MMNKRIKKIIRHGQPGTLDHAQQGTSCFVDLGKEHDIYVQVSPDESYPRWEILGTYPHGYKHSILKEEIEKFKTLKF